MTKRSQPSPRVLTDPQAIKALAHPARLAVLEALEDGGELTATACAEAAGLSPSAMSYHLRALEKWGFVERVESSDGRERPWRAVAGGWRVEGVSDRVTITATNAVVTSMLSRIQGDIAAWFEAESRQPKPWHDVAAVENSAVWLTTDEAAELQRLNRDYLAERRGRTAREHPDGARRVRATRVLIPLQLD